MTWRLFRNGGEGHVSPDLERASAEVYGRVVAITEQLERLVEQCEQELREGEERG